MKLRWLASGAGAGLLALALTVSGGVAQDATPDAGDMAMGDGGIPHPAHIHAGTCVELDPSPLFPLADIVIPPAGMAMGEATPAAGEEMATPVTGDMGTPEAGADMATPVVDGGMGVAGAIPAGQSTTVVPAGLTDILAADHAINVHLSYEQVDVYIACGTIGGTPDANDNLFIGLAEQNDSGYSGIAWLHDNGDGTTTVTVFLAWGLHGEDMAAMDGAEADAEATPMEDATPAA